MITIGPEHFRDMPAGFRTMDGHFRNTPFGHNIPLPKDPLRYGIRISSKRRLLPPCLTTDIRNDSPLVCSS
nr:hypothetical protein [Candidatus Brocadia sapporoensis]